MKTKQASAQRPAVGVIGLGIMGSSISANLAAAGFPVVGYDPVKARCKALTKAGGTVAASAAEVAAQCRFVLLSLPSVAALEAVCAEIAGAAARGTGVAELSTLPGPAKQAAHDLLARAGVGMLDCPLSGTGAQARTRDLAVYASGDAKLISRFKPVFEGFARVCYEVGEFGRGMQMKLVANLLVAIHNVSTAEALLLGSRMGLDPQLVVDVVSDGAGGSRMLQVRGPMMARRGWDEATMKVDVWQKDMHLIGDALDAHAVPAPLFGACVPIYHAAMALGHAQDDTAAVYDVLERWAAPAAPAARKSAKAGKATRTRGKTGR